MFDFFKDYQGFGMEGVEAAMESVTGFERGLSAFSNEWSGFAERSMSESQSTVERMLKADSMETALEVQSEFAQSAYDAYIGQMSSFSNLYARMAEDATKPLQSISKNMH